MFNVMPIACRLACLIVYLHACMLHVSKQAYAYMYPYCSLPWLDCQFWKCQCIVSEEYVFVSNSFIGYRDRLCYLFSSYNNIYLCLSKSGHFDMWEIFGTSSSLKLHVHMPNNLCKEMSTFTWNYFIILFFILVKSGVCGLNIHNSAYSCILSDYPPQWYTS